MIRCKVCVSNIRCPVCHSLASDPSIAPCLHIFCTHCITTWLLSNHEDDLWGQMQQQATQHREARGKCPICKQSVVVDELLRLKPQADEEEGEHAAAVWGG